MAYVRRHEGATVRQIKDAYQESSVRSRRNGMTVDVSVLTVTKTEVRGWIRSAQLKGAPIATTAYGVIIARGSAVYQQAVRMKIHAIGELRNAALLMGTRLNDRLAGQLDSMGRRPVR